MSTNQNIFEFLSDQDSDDENQKNQKGEKRVRTRGKKQQTPQQQTSNDNDLPDRSRRNVDTKHKKDYKKNTGPSERNRSKDRHSGTGISGVQKNNYRKRGAGQGNIGTVKDDIQGRTYNREGEDAEEEEEEEEQEDNRITLDQYFEQSGANLEDALQGQQQEQRKVKKVDEAQLKKDKLELVQERPEIKSSINQKSKKQSNYKPGYQGDMGELLSFRTGFVAQEKKKRVVKQQEETTQQEGEQKEGETTTEATTTENKEGEQQPRRNNNRDNNRNNNNRNNNNNRRNNNNNRENNRNNNRNNNRQTKSKGFQGGDDDFPTL